MAFYRRIRDLREDNDKTQKEIAEYLGMKQPQYYRYDILIKLSRYYNVSIDYLLGVSDTKEIR